MPRFSEVAAPHNASIQEKFNSLISRMNQKGIKRVSFADDLLIDNEGNLVLDAGTDLERRFSKDGGLDWFLLFQTIIRIQEIEEDMEDRAVLAIPQIERVVPFVLSRLDELAA